MTCSANEAQYCGGSDRLSLYVRSVEEIERGPITIPNTSSSSSQAFASTAWTTYTIVTVTTSLVVSPFATNASLASLARSSVSPTTATTSSPLSTRPLALSMSGLSTPKLSLGASPAGNGWNLTTSRFYNTKSTTQANVVSLVGSANLTSLETLPSQTECCQTANWGTSFTVASSFPNTIGTLSSATGLWDTSHFVGTNSSAGKAAGIAIGTTALVGLLAGIGYLITRARRKQKEHASDGEGSEWWEEQETGKSRPSTLSRGLRGGIKLMRDI